MTREAFEKLIEEEFPSAVPEKFRHLIKNVAFLVEDEPSPEVRQREGLGPHETLLGLYQGIPHTARGDWYGVGGTLPDTITLYRGPLEQEAAQILRSDLSSGLSKIGPVTLEAALRRAVRETIWHEVAHYMGYDEHQVRGRENERDS